MPRKRDSPFGIEHCDMLREWLGSAAVDYGFRKPVPRSAPYRSWVKRWELPTVLSIFNAHPCLARCAARLRQVIRGTWVLKWTHFLELERHLVEAHARWLRDTHVASKAKHAQAGGKSAEARARQAQRWHQTAARCAEKAWRHDPGRSASSIAEQLVSGDVVEKRSKNTVRQFLATLSPKKASVSSQK